MWSRGPSLIHLLGDDDAHQSRQVHSSIFGQWRGMVPTVGLFCLSILWTIFKHRSGCKAVLDHISVAHSSWWWCWNSVNLPSLSADCCDLEVSSTMSGCGRFYTLIWATNMRFQGFKAGSLAADVAETCILPQTGGWKYHTDQIHLGQYATKHEPWTNKLCKLFWDVGNISML